MTTLAAAALFGAGSFETLGPVVWAGGLILFICFLFLMLSRTPPSQPLRKCVLLSLFAHALLALYATTVPFLPVLNLGRLGNPFAEERIAITRIEAGPEGESGESPGSENAPRKSVAPWDELPASGPPRATPAELPRVDATTARAVARRDVNEAFPPPLEPSAAFSPREAIAEADDGSPPLRENETPAETADAPNVEPTRAPEMTAAASEAARVAEPANDAAPTPTPLVRPDRAALPPRELDPQAAPAEPAARPEVDSSSPPTATSPETAVARRADRETSDANVPAPSRVEPSRTDSTRDDDPFAPVARPANVARSPRDGDAFSAPSPVAAASSLPPLAPSAVAPLTRRTRTTASDVPDVYKLRMEPKRAEVLEDLGGSTETESAVQAALAWLAAAQSRDGRWDALRYGAGQERVVDGRDRNGAGARSDNGVTGLALLAFLGAGQTHQVGEHRETVRRGIDFLVRDQTADGCLAGDATFYEFMYCHAMAAFALSECWALSGDPALEGPVRRAVTYTLRAQDPRGGSWRYRPGDPGDTSVLGWQIMALKSAEVGGVPIPRATREGVQRYLSTVAQGRFGGTAGYRPGEPATRTMTAEALVCRQFLGFPMSEVARREAAEFLLSELPGQGEVNDYYWYYASLALHERGGDDWDRWNEALQRTLLPKQRRDGSLAGSWDPRGVWGGHGGRVYSTAVAVLSLEVYYRYQHASGAPPESPVRQADRSR